MSDSKFKVGDKVILGRHDPDPYIANGFCNWASEMEKYIGKEAILKRCYGEHNKYGWMWMVDLDREVYAWHEKNMLPTLATIMASTPVKKSEGTNCSRCRDFVAYVEPDDKFVCYSCRH